MEKQTVLILETVLISIWLWKCPSYSTYIRDVFEKIETVPILETVLILEMKEYMVQTLYVRNIVTYNALLVLAST